MAKQATTFSSLTVSKDEYAGRVKLTSRIGTDPTFFPDRAAKIFYRPASDPSAQSAHLMDTGASADNDLKTNVPEPSGPTFVQASLPDSEKASEETPARPAVQSKPSALDTLKDKLLSALPTGSAKDAADEAQKKAAQLAQKDVEIGIMGILHPTVLSSFELEYPCSVFEITLEGL